MAAAPKRQPTHVALCPAGEDRPRKTRQPGALAALWSPARRDYLDERDRLFQRQRMVRIVLVVSDHP
jgi:hypothetical protein